MQTTHCEAQGNTRQVVEWQCRVDGVADGGILLPETGPVEKCGLCCLTETATVDTHLLGAASIAGNENDRHGAGGWWWFVCVIVSHRFIACLGLVSYLSRLGIGTACTGCLMR